MFIFELTSFMNCSYERICIVDGLPLSFILIAYHSFGLNSQFSQQYYGDSFPGNAVTLFPSQLALD